MNIICSIPEPSKAHFSLSLFNGIASLKMLTFDWKLHHTFMVLGVKKTQTTFVKKKKN